MIVSYASVCHGCNDDINEENHYDPGCTYGCEINPKGCEGTHPLFCTKKCNDNWITNQEG